MTTAKLGCPKCGSPHLWEDAAKAGWIDVAYEINESGSRLARPQGNGEFYGDVELEGMIHCTDEGCGWEGYAGELVQLDAEGKPIPSPTLGQTRLDTTEGDAP